MQQALRRKPFVNLTLTEEASLMDVTLHSGGGKHGDGGDLHGHGHGHDGHGHGHDKLPTHGHGGGF